MKKNLFFERISDVAETAATSTRNRNFQRQVPGNCSDKEPYFLPDYQGNTAFVLPDRDARGDGIPVKNRHFLASSTVCAVNSYCFLAGNLRKLVDFQFEVFTVPKAVCLSCQPSDLVVESLH